LYVANPDVRAVSSVLFTRKVDLTVMIIGHRKRNEVVRNNESQLRLLVQGVKDYAILMLDPSGRVLTWNEGAERIKGYRADEITGQHFSRFYAPESVAAGRPVMELEIARETGRFEEEGWRVRKDGSRFWANVVITALHDEAGKLRGFAKVTRDITGRRQAEEALRESNENLRLLAQGVKDCAILRLDPQGNITTWNEGAERIKGYRAEEIIGEHFSKLYPQEAIDAGHPAQELKMATERGSFEEEGWRVRKDGSRFWASVVITRLLDEVGRVRGFAKVTRDITDRQQSESYLRLLTERLSLATSVAQVGIWEWDLASNTLIWDDTMREIYGFPAIVPASYERFAAAVLPEDLPCVESCVQKAIAEKGRQTLEFRIMRTDGVVRNISTVFRVFVDEKTKRARLVGVNTDITGRMQDTGIHGEDRERMAYLAQHDSLTGLPNRVLLLDRCNQTMKLAARRSHRVPVLFLDLDDFKEINDSLGHSVGDKLLKSVATRLVGCVRSADTVSRYGGDEFVILLSEADHIEHPVNLADMTDRILKAVSGVHCVEQHKLYITCSIGVSIYPDDGRDLETLIANADIAMYRAKKKGNTAASFSVLG
jgi:diguanylate cyclase (GGDEF)-like protein/PAS domain S-box-containing protein